MIFINMDELQDMAVWRGVLSSVILGVCAPVFFIADLLEILLDWIGGAEEGEEE